MRISLFTFSIMFNSLIRSLSMILMATWIPVMRCVATARHYLLSSFTFHFSKGATPQSAL